MRLFRERLLARLVETHAISPELGKKLLAWKHPGFSAHVGERIARTDKLAGARSPLLEQPRAPPAGVR